MRCWAPGNRRRQPPQDHRPSPAQRGAARFSGANRANIRTEFAHHRAFCRSTKTGVRDFRDISARFAAPNGSQPTTTARRLGLTDGNEAAISTPIKGKNLFYINSLGAGWGARIRTWDRGTKTRCLTTWLRPNEGCGRHDNAEPTGRQPAPRTAPRCGGKIGWRSGIHPGASVPRIVLWFTRSPGPGGNFRYGGRPC